MEESGKHRFRNNWCQRSDVQSRGVCSILHIQVKETLVKLHTYYGLNCI